MEKHEEVYQVDLAKHAWAKFPVGAWREIEIVTETAGADGSGISRSVTTQLERLKSVTNDQYVLEVQATVDLAGKKIVGQARPRLLNIAMNKSGQVLESHRQEDQEILAASGLVQCQVWDVVYSDDSNTKVDHIFYAPDTYPYVLRRESASASGTPDGLSPTDEVATVIARELSYSHQAGPLDCACVQTVSSSEKGSTVRLTMQSPAVPGGEVTQWATDFDTAGKRTKWSRQELVGYGQRPRQSETVEVPKPLNRRQLRRARRKQQPQ